MMPPRARVLPLAGFCVVAAVATLVGGTALAPAALAGEDITTDATTMATTRNLWTGESAWLTDGRTPDADPEAPAFTWEWVGLLAACWPDTVRLEAIQVYLGTMGRYRVFGYLGGGFTEDGMREGIDTPAFAAQGAVPPGTEGWHEIPCDPDTLIDNLSFQVLDGAVIYEMRFVAPGGAPAQPGLVRRGLLGMRGALAWLLRPLARLWPGSGD